MAPHLRALTEQATTAATVPGIRFEEIAQQAGLHFVTHNCPTPNKNQPETMVAGVALFDYDGDGFLDVYLVNGAEIPSLEKTSPAYWNRLFRNNHDGTFTDVTEKAGVAGAGYGMGVAVGDYDNDGRPTCSSPMSPAISSSTTTATARSPMSRKAGVAGAHATTAKRCGPSAPGWFDYNNDGLLDLFVVNYCQWEVEQGSLLRAQRGPARLLPSQSICAACPTRSIATTAMAHSPMSRMKPALRRVFGKGMGVTFADYDGDGFLDAFVANDTMPNFLFHNIGGKRFEEVAVAAGVAYSPDGNALSGMGSDFRDVNNDGLPDIWHTAVEHEAFPLYMNQGGGILSTPDVASGLGKLTNNMTGWSNGIYDFDNDGWKDLFVARANVMDNIQQAVPAKRILSPTPIFRNLGNGKFQDVSARRRSRFPDCPVRIAAWLSAT